MIPVVCLNSRVDALYLAFDLQVSDGMFELATDCLEVVREYGRGTIELGGLQWAVKGPARSACLTASNGDWRLRWELQARTWALELRARAEYLCEADPEEVICEARRIAQSIGTVIGERLRRVDLAADFVGFELQDIDPGAWVRHPRSKMTEHNRPDRPDAIRQYRDRNLHRTGFAIAPGNVIQARIYDKTRELGWWKPGERSGAVPELPDRPGSIRPMRSRSGVPYGEWRPWSDHDRKLSLEHDRWLARGWNGKDDVTRVEFQLRGEALREICNREPDRITERDQWWAYLVGLPGDARATWLRLVVPDSATRLRRCPLDPRWDAVQRVVFSRAAQRKTVRVRRAGFAAIGQTWGCLLTALARADRLDVPAVSPERLRSGEEAGELLAGTPERDLVGRWWDTQTARARNLFVDAMLDDGRAAPGFGITKVLWGLLAAAARVERTRRDE